MAAGLRIRKDRIPEFREKMNREGAAKLEEKYLTPALKIDAELVPGELDSDLLGQIERLAPFGPGNPRPLFLFRSARLAGNPIVLKEKHLRFNVTGQNGGKVFEAIYFNGAPQVNALRDAENRFHMVCEPSLNTFRGRTTIQLVVKDMAPGEALV
jgi:single-stranded-DNA-specific exonuclease